jgi:hypothetical protein
VIESTKMRWEGHVARMWEDRKAYWILVPKPEGKRPLGSPRHGWEDNIKMDLKQIGSQGVDWIDLARDNKCQAVVNTSLNLRVP